MRKVILSLAAALTVATPALANEGRVEARGGIIFSGGAEEAVAGAAAGYDWDLGQSTFFGVEASADKVLVDGSDVYYGATGRFGFKATPETKIYADAGYTFGEGEDVPHLGAGIEQQIGTNLYGKVGYRHFFADQTGDADTVAFGLGLRF